MTAREERERLQRGKLHLPFGAEQACAEHLQDLLLTDEGRALLVAAAESDDAEETEALAQWLADALTNGVDVEVHDVESNGRRRASPR